MRIVGLIIAGSLVAGCSGSVTDDSHDDAANVPAAANAQTANPPTEPLNEESGSGTNSVTQTERVSPCQTQGADRLQVASIRAIGTEPFWGARVEGRCVTYSTPENQQGTRVWTRYSARADGLAAWAGQLNGKPFEMRVRPQAGCSDGMSDNRYPMAVELLVDGEQRRGCAEPL